jgi:hypothetical protein
VSVESIPSTDRRIGRGVWATVGGIIRLLCQGGFRSLPILLMVPRMDACCCSTEVFPSGGESDAVGERRGVIRDSSRGCLAMVWEDVMDAVMVVLVCVTKPPSMMIGMLV